jgi:NADH:ubiquinone oxidoreductase subunit 3 (subunit A)
MASYLPILVMGVLAAALPLGTTTSRAPSRPAARTRQGRPYECGGLFDDRVRHPLRSGILIAVLFVVFDVETIFLSPGQ